MCAPYDELLGIATNNSPYFLISGSSTTPFVELVVSFLQFQNANPTPDSFKTPSNPTPKRNTTSIPLIRPIVCCPGLIVIFPWDILQVNA